MGFGSKADGYALGTFSKDGGRPFAGVTRDGSVWPLSKLEGLEALSSVLDAFENWGAVDATLARVMSNPDLAPALAIETLKVCAPIAARQIFCTGANYRKHVIELTLKQPDPSTEGLTPEERGERVARMMDERARTGTPYAFVKLPSAITGPYDKIILPTGAKEPDWELELAVVMGKSARNVSRARALEYVGGYMIANDVTARDRIYRADMKAIGTDWLASKNAATFLPIGPFVVPARFITNPQDLRIVLKLNGDTMQNETTADMIFDIARQIEYVSSYVTLLPGDIICTGSPAGNGTHYQRFLQPGDIVEGAIEGLGVQCLECVAE